MNNHYAKIEYNFFFFWGGGGGGRRSPTYNNLEPIYVKILLVRGDQDSRANLMPIYGDLYQIKL